MRLFVPGHDPAHQWKKTVLAVDTVHRVGRNFGA